MRKHTAILASALLLAGSAALVAAPARMSPDDIKNNFFSGKPFTASTPSNTRFRMVFTPDGKVTRTPVAKKGAKGEGEWKLSQDGFCTTWKGAKPNCFRIIASGNNRWSVLQGTTVVATWSR
jgi:hypothetical protein